MAVTERGAVISWGADTWGRCGHGSSDDQKLLPRRVQTLIVVRARCVLAGGFHNLVMTEEGTLYLFGLGADGQLGHGSVGEEHSRRMIDALRYVRITVAAAGMNHPLALAKGGTVFS